MKDSNGQALAYVYFEDEPGQGTREQPFAQGVARASICLDDAIVAGSF